MSAAGPSPTATTRLSPPHSCAIRYSLIRSQWLSTTGMNRSRGALFLPVGGGVLGYLAIRGLEASTTAAYKEVLKNGSGSTSDDDNGLTVRAGNRIRMLKDAGKAVLVGHRVDSRQESHPCTRCPRLDPASVVTDTRPPLKHPGPRPAVPMDIFSVSLLWCEPSDGPPWTPTRAATHSPSPCPLACVPLWRTVTGSSRPISGLCGPARPKLGRAGALLRPAQGSPRAARQ